MKRFIKWFVEYPVWTFIAAVLGILGILATVLGWFISPIDPELEGLETLLKDVSNEAIQVSRFASLSNQQIENLLGKRSGWTASTVRGIERMQNATDSVTNSAGYSKMSDHGLRLFTDSNSSLERYKDGQFLQLRTAALRQHACGLIINTVREIGIIHGKSDIESCFPITEDCKLELKNYSRLIQVDLGRC